MEVLDLYLAATTSWTIGLGSHVMDTVAPLWRPRKPVIHEITTFCQQCLGWSESATLLKRFEKVLWGGVICHMLCSVCWFLHLIKANYSRCPIVWAVCSLWWHWTQTCQHTNTCVEDLSQPLHSPVKWQRLPHIPETHSYHQKSHQIYRLCCTATKWCTGGFNQCMGPAIHDICCRTLDFAGVAACSKQILSPLSWPSSTYLHSRNLRILCKNLVQLIWPWMMWLLVAEVVPLTMRLLIWHWRRFE